MKKVLIISYFFPPCNLTASQRAYSWARHLHLQGYQPVVITRRWDHPVNKLSDVSETTPDTVIYEKQDHYEAFYLPHKGNLRDRIYAKHGEKRHTFIRKLLTLLELLFQNFSDAWVPSRNLLRFADSYIREHKDIHRIVITGNPFILFKFGYQLHKKHGIPWIADYRDAWTTSEINSIRKSFLFKLIAKIDRCFEEKWSGTASHITSSSAPLANKISQLLKVPGSPLYNGYDPEDFKNLHSVKPFETFTITYAGTLYDGQPIEVFCEAYKQFIDRVKPKAKLLFPGIAFYKEPKARIERLLKGYEPYFESTGRIAREQVLEIEARSQLLLHIAWKGYAGIVASKIYEYIGSGTRILVCPSDNGAIEEIVRESGCGEVFDAAEDVLAFLTSQYSEFQQGRIHRNDITSARVLQFSREEQARELGKLLDTI